MPTQDQYPLLEDEDERAYAHRSIEIREGLFGFELFILRERERYSLRRMLLALTKVVLLGLVYATAHAMVAEYGGATWALARTVAVFALILTSIELLFTQFAFLSAVRERRIYQEICQRLAIYPHHGRFALSSPV